MQMPLATAGADNELYFLGRVAAAAYDCPRRPMDREIAAADRSGKNTNGDDTRSKINKTGATRMASRSAFRLPDFWALPPRTRRAHN